MPFLSCLNKDNNPKSSLKTLVTGATGLVGSAITRRLVDRGEDVRILRRSTSKLDLLRDTADRVEHFVGSITDRDVLDAAMDSVDRVYHVAARIGFRGDGEADLMHRVNVEGTRRVVNAAVGAGVKRLVHTSSIAALGRPMRKNGMIDETQEWEESVANTVYGKTKYDAELEIHRGIAEGLDAVMVNPSLIFGIGREGENTRQVIDKVRKRTLPAIPVGGNNVVDVLDVADGHLKAMEKGRSGERYILGSENMSWEEIIKTIADEFGVRPPRFHLHPAVGTVLAFGSELIGRLFSYPVLITRESVMQSARTYRYDNSKAVTELGCQFRPFSETIRRIAAALS